MMKLTILFVLIMIALAHAEKDCNNGPFRLTQPVKVCSRYLSCMLENICSNSFKIIKRDTTSIMNKLVPEDLYEFTAKKSMVVAARSRPRRFVGIVDECCDNACSIQELMEYCPLDSKIFELFPLGDT